MISLSTSVFILSNIHEILETTFYVLSTQQVETGPNYSYKLATLLKYHMPSKFIILVIDQINDISRNHVRGNGILHLVTEKRSLFVQH